MPLRSVGPSTARAAMSEVHEAWKDTHRLETDA